VAAIAAYSTSQPRSFTVAFESESLLNDKLKRTLVNDADHIGLFTQPATDRHGLMSH
jgi:hypothetical protein